MRIVYINDSSAESLNDGTSNINGYPTIRLALENYVPGDHFVISPEHSETLPIVNKHLDASPYSGAAFQITLSLELPERI